MAQNRAGAEAKRVPSNSNSATTAVKQVLQASGKGGFILDDDNLRTILLADGIMDKPVIVISVAGAFRKGKSFLLDMMLRYLKARDKSNWINEPATKGFPWQGGYKRHTTGILMWSQPIPVTLPDGTEAVILLMDTQGTFDNQSTAHESSTVFALSTLLSSLQIYNLTGNLQNDDLEHLQLFTEYGRMALAETDGTKPFQKLLFLVRDWHFVIDFPLGAEGGDGLVKEWLDTKTRKSELEKVRKHIRDCFSEIKGFLLPHPGPRMVSKQFDGNSADMDPTFVTQLQELMPKLLAPENLTVKTIAGNSVKGRDLYTFFGTYTALFQSDELPKPKNIMQATAEANNMAAVMDARTQYIKEMEFLLREDESSLGQGELLRKHQEASDKADKAFCDRKKMGGWKTSEYYRTKLREEIHDWFKFAEQANDIKRQKERLSVESHNLGLVGTCKMAYRSEMEPVAGRDAAYVPLEDMDSAHEKAKRKAMYKFDAEKKTFDGVEDTRRPLAHEIDTEFRQMLIHNEVKKDAVDAVNFKAAQANHKAVNKRSTTSSTRTNTNRQAEDDMLARAMSLSMMEASQRQGPSPRTETRSIAQDEDEELAMAMSLSIAEATDRAEATASRAASRSRQAEAGARSRQSEAGARSRQSEAGARSRQAAVSGSGQAEAGSGISMELQCPVCYELFRKATTLGCGHTFCFVCVETASLSRRNGKCPVCRAPVQSVSHCVALDNVIKSLGNGTRH